jgi:hypothetical protein
MHRVILEQRYFTFIDGGRFVVPFFICTDIFDYLKVMVLK